MMQSDYKTMKAKEFQARLESRLAKKKKAEPEIKEEEEPEEEATNEFVKGTLVKLSEIPDGYTREVLKEKWYAATNEEKFEVRYPFPLSDYPNISINVHPRLY
jgi:hypothetical protein